MIGRLVDRVEPPPRGIGHAMVLLVEEDDLG